VTLASAASVSGIVIFCIVPIVVWPFVDVCIVKDRHEVIAVLGKCDHVQWQITIAIEMSGITNATLYRSIQGASLVDATLKLAHAERVSEAADAFRRTPACSPSAPMAQI